MSAYSDLGPQGPTRMEVCLLATEIQRMAGQARDLCTPGAGLDVARAVRILGTARTMLDGLAGDGGRVDADG